MTDGALRLTKKMKRQYVTKHFPTDEVAQALASGFFSAGNVVVTIPSASIINISEVNGTSIIVTSNCIITVPDESSITISEVSGTEIYVVSNATITITDSSAINIYEATEIIVEANICALIEITEASAIFSDNNNPIVSITSKLMTLSPTLQLQVGTEFIEGTGISLERTGVLVVTELIEGSTLTFDSTGKVTAFEFIEGGL